MNERSYHRIERLFNHYGEGTMMSAADAIDVNTCALLLRATTDEIAASFVRPAPDATLNEILDYVETLNTWAEGELRGQLQRRYPQIGWSDADEARGETQARPMSDAPYWVYDPVDAVYHTMQGLPLWSASLALVSGGEAKFGAVYDPTAREMFLAVKDGGAHLNGRLLRPAAKTRLQTAIVATFLTPPFAHGDLRRHEQTLSLISAVSKAVFVVRQMASASLHLAYVAAGRLDALFDVSSTMHDWLAGGLLVREAGLQITGLDGGPFDWGVDGVIASGGALNQPLVDIIGAALAEPPAFRAPVAALS